jgi:Tol biopolymer transport system component
MILPATTMLMSPDTRFGAYEVQALIGRGGMSEVYRARDVRLNREVAVKVLGRPFASDPAWLTRFDREAQLLAALNHPHVAQIYGFEELSPSAPDQHTMRALIMELVDGSTLAERIASGPIPVEEALSIAGQIAEALEAAHERGIVHRDLKPANVKLTTAGVVKVLDFGLGKLVTPGDSVELAVTTSSSPTVTAPATQSGVILGTAAYMAPEQARGQAVDERTDIWAFGVVTYEMLTGQRPFEGETASDTIAAVLRQEVDWGRLPPQTPGDVKRMLRRCLERNPKNRWQDAGDLRLAIADARLGTEAIDDGRGPSRVWSSRWLLVALAAGAVVVATALGAAWTLLRDALRADAPKPVVRFAIEPPSNVSNISYIAAAADGRFIVYEGQIDGEFHLFLRRFDELTSRQLAGTEGGRGPFVSPDGTWIGFVRGGKIYKMPAAGGDAVAVCNVQGGPGAAWSADGRIVFSRAWLSGLSIVSADGGTPADLTTPDRSKHEIGHWWPSVLPGGGILFTIATDSSGLNDARIAVLDPATGTYRVLLHGAKAEWLPSGHLVFYHAGRYRAVPFDLSSATVSGESFPVLDDAREIDPAGDWSQTVAVTSTGALAYLAGAYVPASRLTWIDTEGRSAPLAFPPRPYVAVKLSPDGRRAATASLEAGRLLLRVFDLERGTEEAPKIEGMNWNPVWLPDGRLSFTSMRKGDFDVYVKDVAGTGAEQPVLDGADDTDPIAWTRDGRLVFQGSEPDGAYPLKLFDPRQPARITRLTEQHVDNGGSLSPDERWLAYQSAAIGRSVVYVRSLATSEPATALSRDPGEFPVFLRDGKTLALVRGKQLVVRPWHVNGGRFEIGAERVVTQLTFGSGWTYGSPYDTADGGRFLAIVRTEDAPPPRVRVILGWDHEVTRLGRENRTAQ